MGIKQLSLLTSGIVDPVQEKMPRKLKQKHLLPKCEGPKLDVFKDRVASIDFKRLISENDDPEDTSGGGQAHVFEVSILFKTYALKMVRLHI